MKRGSLLPFCQSGGGISELSEGFIGQGTDGSELQHNRRQRRAPFRGKGAKRAAGGDKRNGALPKSGAFKNKGVLLPVYHAFGAGGAAVSPECGLIGISPDIGAGVCIGGSVGIAESLALVFGFGLGGSVVLCRGVGFCRSIGT